MSSLLGLSTRLLLCYSMSRVVGSGLQTLQGVQHCQSIRSQPLHLDVRSHVRIGHVVPSRDIQCFHVCHNDHHSKNHHNYNDKQGHHHHHHHRAEDNFVCTSGNFRCFIFHSSSGIFIGKFSRRKWNVDLNASAFEHQSECRINGVIYKPDYPVKFDDKHHHGDGNIPSRNNSRRHDNIPSHNYSRPDDNVFANYNGCPNDNILNILNNTTTNSSSSSSNNNNNNNCHDNSTQHNQGK
mmetsp:Transcript_88452/g.235227  ORF Transcript_88452/g.235227 Transcript_88452/m.235227 type:complete len:238 (+) Transcript_88452:1037-1750(+)